MSETLRTYFYRVLLPHGRVRAGLLRLVVAFDHSARLRLEQRTEGTVLTLWRLPHWISTPLDFIRQSLRRQVSNQDVAGFLRDMGLMLAAGVPAMEALTTLIEDDAGLGAVAVIAGRVHADLGSGISTAETFARHPDIFPETVRNLVTIGDQSGALPQMLTEAAEHMERMIDIQRDIRTALIYPMFVFATIFAVAAFWMYYVVPSMSRLFKQLGAKLPPLTTWLLAVSDTLVGAFGWALLAFLLIVACCLWAYKRVFAVRRSVHLFLHHLPVARVLLTSSGMAFITEHLALLVRTGLDFVTSLDVLTRATRDLYYRERLAKVRDSVARGEGIAASMRRVGGFPSMAVRMIAVGEESGSLDQQLSHLASEYRKRLAVVVNSLAEIIKPAIILVAGAFFLFLVVALLLPIYDLVRQSVGHSLGGG